MSIYVMKRCYKNGKPTKKAIVYFEAKNKDEAYQAFGAGRYWSGYPELTRFDAIRIDSVKGDEKVIAASKVIKAHRKKMWNLCNSRIKNK